MAVQHLDAGFVDYEAGAAGATTSFTFPLPAGTLPGDTFIVSLVTKDAHAIASAPSDATVIFTTTNTSPDMTLWVWQTPAEPPATAVFATSAPEEGSLSWMRFRGVDVAAPLAGGPVPASAGTWELDNHVAPTLMTTADAAMVVGGLGLPSGSRALTVESPWTIVADPQVRKGALAVKGVQDVAGSTGAARWTVGGNTGIRSLPWQAALRPAPGGSDPDPVSQAALIYSWVGAPAPDGFAVSCKTELAASVRVVAGTDADLTADVAYSALAAPDGDGWSRCVVTGLDASTPYYYALEMTDADGLSRLSAVAGPVATLPAVGAPASFGFGFGSCLESGSTETRAFTRMLARGPLLAFHLGDFHYADNTSISQASHRVDMEAQIAANSGLRALLANVPVIPVKSDHDVGGGNGVLPGAWTAPNLAAFKQVAPLLSSPVADANYGTLVVGRVKFIVTDHRYLRTATSMMGAAQKAWFKSELVTDEPVKIWVMDSPWVNHDAPLDTTDANDKWSDYPDEHEELGAYIAASAVGQVIGIHGDMHALASDDGSNNDWGGFPTFNAAPFDKRASIKGGPWSEGTYPSSGTAQSYQYGWVDVTDDGTDITVAYTGYDSSNAARVPLSVVVDTTQVQPESPWFVWGGSVLSPLALGGVWDGAGLVPARFGGVV
ncbi:hypothetical protein L332_03690 [Agrococcus pavilionensis RW1]|uniref:PhoD-like phosphatase metallophosphatase domain-containing protein n=1 Tax=Agrococcus pavilionensis RW1 TaxID=1330458 RepID=U1LMI1_9MICO|nr:alkaline phosphatase D family protein [Agrococcus pavilionensis]ERG63554.1 hypothetical protein L332_03690 [Agrococcus pavilionensis RW1]